MAKATSFQKPDDQEIKQFVRNGKRGTDATNDPAAAAQSKEFGLSPAVIKLLSNQKSDNTTKPSESSKKDKKLLNLAKMREYGPAFAKNVSGGLKLAN